MEALKKLPPPTLEEVELTFRAAEGRVGDTRKIRDRIIADAEYVKKIWEKTCIVR